MITISGGERLESFIFCVVI